MIAVALGRSRLWGALVAALLVGLPACGPANPVLGEWEMDPRQTSLGAATYARQTGFDRIAFERDRVLTGDIELNVRYIVEEDRVRVLRQDRDHEDVVQILEGGSISVELPPGISVVYRRAGPGAG